MEVLESLTRNAHTATSTSGMQSWLIGWFGHLADMVRETGNGAGSSAALAASIDEHAVALATTISSKAGDLIDQETAADKPADQPAATGQTEQP